MSQEGAQAWGRGAASFTRRSKGQAGGIEQEQAGGAGGGRGRWLRQRRRECQVARLTLLGEAEVPVWVHGWVGSFEGRVGQGEAPSSLPTASL